MTNFKKTKKKNGFEISLKPALWWCRRPESNRYEVLASQDFKSCASASSATPAWRRHPDLNWGVKDLQSSALPLGYVANQLTFIDYSRGHQNCQHFFKKISDFYFVFYLAVNGFPDPVHLPDFFNGCKASLLCPIVQNSLCFYLANARQGHQLR